MSYEDIPFETSVTFNQARREWWLSFTSKTNELGVVCAVISELANRTNEYKEFIGLTHGGRGVFTLRFSSLEEIGKFLDWLETCTEHCPSALHRSEKEINSL